MILPMLVHVLMLAEARYTELARNMEVEGQRLMELELDASDFWRHAQLVSAHVSTWPKWKRGGSAAGGD